LYSLVLNLYRKEDTLQTKYHGEFKRKMKAKLN